MSHLFYRSKYHRPHYENQDFTAIAQKRPTAQGNQTSFTDHAMKIDMAKEIAMIQRKC